MNDNFVLSTPVALFVYNRPEYTAEVFSRITEIEPPRLFIVADGPRDQEDQRRTKAVREVVDDVSWTCCVERLYADKNLGLKRRFVTGLNHIFDVVDRAIILEDDTVPDPTFFQFCQTLLNRYSGDDRIMEITGRNQLGTWRADSQDYHFSYNGGIWGWATWSECWDAYDPEMELWDDPTVRNRIRDIMGSQWQFNHMHRVYQTAYEGRNEAWSYPWTFARQLNSGLSVVPARNLVANIGFGEGATHTTDKRSPWAGTNVYSADFPLSPPPYTVVDGEYERAFHQLRPGRWKEHPLIYPFWRRLSALTL
jgi:hypothetical protein